MSEQQNGRAFVVARDVIRRTGGVVNAAWRDRVAADLVEAMTPVIEAAVREQIVRERRALDSFPEIVEEYGTELAGLTNPTVARIGAALVSAARVVRGEQP